MLSVPNVARLAIMLFLLVLYFSFAAQASHCLACDAVNEIFPQQVYCLSLFFIFIADVKEHYKQKWLPIGSH